VSIPVLTPRSQGYFSKPSFESALAEQTISGLETVVKSVRLHCDSVDILNFEDASIFMNRSLGYHVKVAKLLAEKSSQEELRAETINPMSFNSG
jgi:hypothetical protein